MPTQDERESDPRARSIRLYRMHDGEASPPNYARVVASLSLAELLQEAAAGRGERAYQEAVARELELRS